MISILCLVATGVLASTPVIWKQSGQGDFLKGKTSGISITNKGSLTLSPALDLIFESDEPLVWCLEKDSRGNLYVGTGNDGKLYRINSNGHSEVFFDADELEIRSMAIDKNDQLYVATFPDGRIYKITADGTHSVYFEPPQDSRYIWSLALDKSGNLYAGTGEQGRIFRIDKKGTGHLLVELEEAHVMSLILDESGRLLAGTAPGGRIYRITPSGELSVLYDSPYGEVNTLQVDENGFVFAGVLSEPSRGGRGVPSTSSKANSDNSASDAKFGIVEVTTSVEGSDRTYSGGYSPRGSLVYRINPAGRVEEWWKSQVDMCFSLAIRESGELLIGTGPRGRLFSVNERGSSTLLNEIQASQITSLMPVASGGVFAATSNRGNLYQLQPLTVREGNFESIVRDTRGNAHWGRIRWEKKQPPGTTVRIYARSGNTDSPDQTWSDWTGPYTDSEGEALVCPPARYLQWKALLNTNNEKTPSISTVSAAYLTRNNPPSVHSVTIYEPGVYLRDSSPGSIEQAELPPDIAVQVAGRRDGIGTKASVGVPAYRKGMRAISIQASDPDGDALSYDIFFRGEGEETWKLMKEKRHIPSYSWDSETFPDGDYIVRVKVSDIRSNQEDLALEAEYLSGQFRVDNTGPRVTNIHATSDRISFFVQDDASPLFRVEYAINAGDWRVVHPEDGVTDSKTEKFVISLVRLEPGEHTLAIRARDTSNNTGTGKRVVTISFP